MASAAKNRFKQDEKRRDSDHVSFLKHRGFRWLWIALALSGASIAGYALIDQQPRPNGGTWYGYTLGTIGFGLIIWLSLLGVRKRRINPGAWSLKAWAALMLPVVGRWRDKHTREKDTLLRMEFRTFRAAFIDLPAQIVQTGRRLVYRFLSWNPWQLVFFRLVDVLRQ